MAIEFDPIPKEEETYNFKSMLEDQELIDAAQRYYSRVGEKSFKNKEELIDHMKSDRRWVDANTVGALSELNKVKGIVPTAAQKRFSEDDKKDLAVIRNRWEKIPGALNPFNDRDTGVMERVGAVAESVAYGAIDPVNWFGGPIGGRVVAAGAKKLFTNAATKEATKASINTAGKIGGAITTDAGITAGANTVMQETDVELGLRTDIDEWEAIKAGLLGGTLSAPGHVAVNLPGKRGIDAKGVRLAHEQAKSEGDKLTMEGFDSLTTDSKRLGQAKSLGVPLKEKQFEDDLTPTGNAAVVTAKVPTKQSTLSSQLNIPSNKVEEIERKVFDYVSGKFLHINDTTGTQDLTAQVKGILEQAVYFEDAGVGKQTFKGAEKSAKSALSKQDPFVAGEAVKGLPENYAPNMVEQATIDSLRGTLLKIATTTDDPDKIARAIEMAQDLGEIDVRMGAETARTLAFRRNKQYTPVGLLGKVTKAIKGTGEVVTGQGTSKGVNDPDAALAIQVALKDLLTPDPRTGEVNKLGVDRFLANLENQNLSWGDRVREAWFNGVLSGLDTQTINVLGNLQTTAIQATEYAAAHSHTPEGSISALGVGYAKGIKDAWGVFKRTFDIEIPTDISTRIETREHQAIPSWKITFGGTEGFSSRRSGVGETGGLFKWDKTRDLPFIGGFSYPKGLADNPSVVIGGRQARIPGRFLMGMDDAFKTVNSHGAMVTAATEQVIAEQAAKGAKFTTEEINNRVNALIAKPTAEMQEYALKIARLNTLTTPLGPLGQGIQHVVNAVPGGWVVVPFIKTPGNILNYAMSMVAPGNKPDWSPIRFGTTRTNDDLKAGGMRQKQALARLTMGYAIMGTGLALSYQGYTTGAAPSDPGEREIWKATNIPWAVQFPDKQVQWSRGDPAAFPLAFGTSVGEIARAMNDPEREGEMATTMAKLFADAVLDKTWFTGVSNTIEALIAPERKMNTFVKGVARSAVPSIVADYTKAADPRVTAPQTFMEVIQDRLGFEHGGKVPYDVDISGREIPVEFLGAEKGDTGVGADIARMFSPIKVKTTDDPVIKELYDLRIRVSPPSHKWHGVSLTSEQMAIYKKAKFKYFYDGVRNYKENMPGWDKLHKGAKRLLIDEMKEEATGFADLALWSTYPDVLKASMRPDRVPGVKEFLAPTRTEIQESISPSLAKPENQSKTKGFFEPTRKELQESVSPGDSKEPLTKPINSDILNKYDITESKTPGIVYDPLTQSITRGPNVSDEQLSNIVKGATGEWRSQTVKVKLEDGTLVDVPAYKLAKLMKSKKSVAKKLLKEFNETE